MLAVALVAFATQLTFAASVQGAVICKNAKGKQKIRAACKRNEVVAHDLDALIARVEQNTSDLANVTGGIDVGELRGDVDDNFAGIQLNSAGVAENARAIAANAPAGLVAIFKLDSCPDDWSPYFPAMGRFVRGFDPAEANVRPLESTQEDAFQGHTFGDPHSSARRFRIGNNRTTAAPPNGFSSMYDSGIYGSNDVYGPTRDAVIATDGVNGAPRISDETRPKNVALLHCVKD